MLVPVKLADSAGVQPHVHAGNRFRNAQLSRCDLTCPAATRLPNMRIGEGKPQVGQRSRIGCRRIEEIRILSLARDVARGRIGAPDTGRPLGSGTWSAALTAVAPRSALAPTAAPDKRSRRVAAFIMFLRFDWSLHVSDYFCC
jgi:hypothetical protein